MSPFAIEKESPAISNEGLMSQSVGLVWSTGEFIPMLEAGWSVPCNDVVLLASENQQSPVVSVEIKRGPEGIDGKYHSLGNYRIVGVAPGVPEVPRIRVTLNAEGKALYLSATDERSGISCGILSLAKENE